jgi:hypothetical protein
MIYTRIREMLGSNLGRYRDFAQSLQANVGIVPQIRSKNFLPYSFKLILSFDAKQSRKRTNKNIWIYRVPQEETSIFWEVTVSVILSKKLYVYMCPIPNGFRDRAISLFFFILPRTCVLFRTVSEIELFHCFFYSSSLLPHLGACSHFWSIWLSFLSFLIRDSR